MNASLTDINLDDLASSFGWQDSPFLRRILRFVFRGAAGKFAGQMLAFDGQTAAHGLPDGARTTLHALVKDVRLFGGEYLLTSHPVLYLSNHPGMTDTLCLFAALGRMDLRVLARQRPFLQALPNISKHLIYLTDDPSERMGALRKASSHLRNGGALLTFPAGAIEPDPDVYAGAREALDKWLDSAAVFLRLAPETCIVPVLVRNVLWEKAVKHPLTWLRSEREGREKLGASLQMLLQILLNVRPVTVTIQAGKPIQLDEIGSRETAAIHAVLMDRMRGLVEHLPLGAGLSVL